MCAQNTIRAMPCDAHVQLIGSLSAPWTCKTGKYQALGLLRIKPKHASRCSIFFTHEKGIRGLRTASSCKHEGPAHFPSSPKENTPSKLNWHISCSPASLRSTKPQAPPGHVSHTLIIYTTQRELLTGDRASPTQQLALSSLSWPRTVISQAQNRRARPPHSAPPP